MLRAKARLQRALISESSLSHLPPFYDEPAPADFRIRVSRSARGVGAKRTAKHRGRRIAALAAAIAVPAVAGPGDWHPIGVLAFQEPAIAAPVTPMAFELPGNSFPGSAFYFLEDAPRMALAVSNTLTPLFDISGTGEADAAQLVRTHGAGPAARSFLSAGGGVSKARALQCLTSAIYYEAASETIGGQRAVAQVVLNRVAHPSYPNSVCGVVYQGSERRTGCQFSFTCDGSLARKPSVAEWDRVRMVAQDALLGDVYQPVGLATHYHTIWIHPYWAPSLDPVGTVGAHRFYRWRGAAGKPGAFRANYSGSEPFAAPSVRKASALAKDTADPLELARQFARDYEYLSTELARPQAVAPRNTGLVSTQVPDQVSAHAAWKGTPAHAPAYSAAVADRGGERLFKAENLPQASGIRPEYANSGRWISDPK